MQVCRTIELGRDDGFSEGETEGMSDGEEEAKTSGAGIE